MPDFQKMIKDFALRYLDECIIILSKKGIIQYATPDVRRICQIDYEEIINQSFIDLIHPDDQRHVKKTFSQLIKESQTEKVITFRTKSKAGSDQFLKTRLINLLEKHPINAIVAYTRDISVQKQIEQTLHQKNKEYESLLERFQIIADNTIDVIFQVTLSGTYTFMNKACKRIAGYEQEEMIGTKWMNYVPKKELPKYLAKVKELLKGKKINDFQTFVIHKKGHLVPVEFSGSVTKKDNKTYINGVMRDLSERLNSKQELEQIARLLEKQAIAKTKELEDREKKYQQLIEYANEAIIVAQDDYIKLANPKTIFLLGYSEEEILSKPFTNFIHPEDVDTVLTRYQERISGKKPISRYEFRIIDKFNTVHWVEISAVQITWNDKPATLNFLTDITERKTLQDKYERLFNNSPENLAEVDGETLEIITVNEQMAESIGVAKEELIGKKWDSFLPDKVYQSRYKIGLEVLKENKTEIFTDKRGNRYFRNIFSPIEYPNGKRNLQIISQDITEMEKAKEKLIENEEQLQAITTSAKDAIILIDNNGLVQFWNPAAETIFGYTFNEIKGKKIHTLLAEESIDDHFIKGFKQFQQTGKGPVVDQSLELTARTKDGTKLIIELSVSSLLLKNTWHAIGIARDITERKHMQESLRKSRDRLEEKVKERTAELESSEKKYRQLFETAPVGIATVDLNGTIFDFNETMKEITGYTPRRNQSFDFKKIFVSQKDRINLNKILKKQGSISNLELDLIRKNGDTYTALLDVQKITISGEKGFLIIQRDISKLKKIRQEIIQTRNYLQNIVDSAQETVIAVDTSKKITMWNTTAEQITGLHSEEVLGKSILSLSVFDNTQTFSDVIRNLTAGYSSAKEETIITSKKGMRSIIRFSATLIDNQENPDETLGVLFIGQDVTKEAQQRGTLMPGASYLLFHSTAHQAVDMFGSFQLQGYKGICFTRKTSVNSAEKTFSPNIPALYYFEETLSQNTSTDQALSQLFDNLESFLQTYQKAIVFFDRMDYLITRYSFEAVLRFLYRITPLISHHQAILILRINPQILTDQQINFLKEELVLVPGEKIEPVELDEHLYEILEYVNILNERNTVVSYQKIGKRFDISKVTTKKRLDSLQKQGLLSVSIQGRMKSVHVTKKAQLLLKRHEQK